MSGPAHDTDRQMRFFKRTFRPALLALVPVLLAGCIGQTIDSVGFINPFRKEKTVLSGERKSIAPTATDEMAAGSPAIGPAGGGDWTQPGGNPQNAPGHVALSGSSGAAVWRARNVAKSGKRAVRSAAPPLVVGGRVFVYSAEGTVSALSGGGGKQWSVSLKPEKENSASGGGGIAFGGNAIFAATGYGELVALDAATGTRIWTYDLEAPARSAPTEAGGKVYVVSVTNVLHAVNVADGSQAWIAPGVAETASLLSAASPAVSGNTVVVPFSSGEIAAFSADDGELKWVDAVTQASRTLAVSGLTDVAASPVIIDGVVYATGVAGRTIAVKLSDGERVWEQNVGSAYTPAISGNALFMVDLEDNVIALERKSGKTFWRTALPVVRKKRFFSVWAGPMLAGNMLWAVSNDGNIASIDPGTGNLVNTRPLGARAYSRPIAAAGQLLVVAGDGSLIAMR